MNNETLKRDLCARLAFKPLIGFKTEDEVTNANVLTLTNASIFFHKIETENFKPILFPTSALTKPIQIANYNNGEPFVPIVEMAKMLGWDVKKCLLNSNTESFGIMCNASSGLMDEDVQDVLAFTVGDGFGWHSRPSKDFHVVLKQPELYDLMHKFHINYRLSPEQFIEVTDEFNPYK